MNIFASRFQQKIQVCIVLETPAVRNITTTISSTDIVHSNDITNDITLKASGTVFEKKNIYKLQLQNTESFLTALYSVKT